MPDVKFEEENYVSTYATVSSAPKMVRLIVEKGLVKTEEAAHRVLVGAIVVFIALT